MPAIDIDIRDPFAAEAVEALARERFEERGYFLVRFGEPPKRAILLRTDQPFPKIVRNLTAPNGDEHKLEILCDGQQVIVFGIIPTPRALRWHGGEPGHIPLGTCPMSTRTKRRSSPPTPSSCLAREFGYTAAPTRKSKADGNGQDTGAGGARTGSS